MFLKELFYFRIFYYHLLTFRGLSFSTYAPMGRGGGQVSSNFPLHGAGGGGGGGGPDIM